MSDINIRLNSKINRVKKSQRRGLKATTANKFSGLGFVTDFPEAATTSVALLLDTNTLQLFVNGKDRWYAIDRFEGTVAEIDDVHIIFVNRPILFYSLFYYNSKNEKIHLSDYFEKLHTDDILIDKLPGYNLYACYIEVVE